MAMLPLIEVNQSGSADDAGRGVCLPERISYAGCQGTMEVHVGPSRSGGKIPTVIVIHENRGLNAY